MILPKGQMGRVEAGLHRVSNSGRANRRNSTKVDSSNFLPEESHMKTERGI